MTTPESENQSIRAAYHVIIDNCEGFEFWHSTDILEDAIDEYHNAIEDFDNVYLLDFERQTLIMSTERNKTSSSFMFKKLNDSSYLN